MSQAKIEIHIGSIQFTGEGDEKWLSEQLDKLLEHAAELASLSTHSNNGGNGDAAAGNGESGAEDDKIPLGTMLKTSGIGNNQTKRFLVAAIWLAGRGNKKPSTRDVSKALGDNHQPKLSNPSQALNDNVKQGYCEKDGRAFYVTPNGFASIKS